VCLVKEFECILWKEVDYCSEQSYDSHSHSARLLYLIQDQHTYEYSKYLVLYLVGAGNLILV
jgi:hypothetical protein